MNAHVTIQPEILLGTMKPMHCVNNGPSKQTQTDQCRSNFNAYKAARIPFARNHDAAFCSTYGGEFTVDVVNIFRNFNADPEDPASYDFLMTDFYIDNTRKAGTETFYRLGSKIEHNPRKYGTLPPPDFHKWAVICEHIIAHYNEGWANGYHWNICYWEIWNEPDLDLETAENKRCWGGTDAQFFELYCIAATHLKNRFPELKIGGPAMCQPWRLDWQEKFFQTLTQNGRRVPLDFFSWHCYMHDPKDIAQGHAIIRQMLDKYGYTTTESHLNEYNYIRNWTTDFVYSVEVITSIKGAAMTAACMAVGQNCGLDMLMYYDARIGCAFNGMFDFYTLRPLKGYYVFPAFADLFELRHHIQTTSDDQDIYAVAAKDEKGNLAAMITYYTDDDEAADRTVEIDLQGYSLNQARFFLLDADHNLDEISPAKIITLKRNSVLQIKTTV